MDTKGEGELWTQYNVGSGGIYGCGLIKLKFYVYIAAWKGREGFDSLLVWIKYRLDGHGAAHL